MSKQNSAKKVYIIIAVVLVLLVAGIIVIRLLPLLNSNTAPVTADTDGDGVLTYKDYIGKKVGILTGSSFEAPTLEFLPDSEYIYYDNVDELIAALTDKKIDCFVEDEPVLRMAGTDQIGLSYLPEMLRQDRYAFCFQKDGEKAELLQKQFNEMLSDLYADGSIETMRSRWFEGDTSAETIDRSGITGANGTLNVFVNPSNVPFTILEDDVLKGYAVELMTEFCRRYGYDCKYEYANISTGLAGIGSGLYDVGANNTTITPEREEKIRFSEPIYYGGISLAVRTYDITSLSDKRSVADYSDKRIGVVAGSVYDGMLKTSMPGAAISYFDKASDMAAAITDNKIDAFVCSDVQAKSLMSEFNNIKVLDLLPEKSSIAFAFPKNEHGAQLRDEFNEYLAKIKADGTYDKLKYKWKTGGNKTVEITVSMDSKAVLTMATTGTTEPYTYMSQGRLTGFDIDLAANFSREYGYDLDIRIMEFGQIIPGLKSGEFDIAGANITVTDERAEEVYFSDSYTSNETAFVVRTTE